MFRSVHQRNDYLALIIVGMLVGLVVDVMNQAVMALSQAGIIVGSWTFLGNLVERMLAEIVVFRVITIPTESIFDTLYDHELRIRL